MLKKAFLAWLPLAAAITGLTGLAYGAVQQNYRQSLNDPQIQMAEDAAAKLSSGALPTSVLPPEKEDIAASLAPYVAVFNEEGGAVVSSGYLNGQLPQPPKGIFEDFYPKGNLPQKLLGSRLASDRVTWQPEPGVRQALVVIPYTSATGSGFVMAGRKMREAESRVQQLTLFAGLAWLCIMTASLLLSVFGAWAKRRS